MTVCEDCRLYSVRGVEPEVSIPEHAAELVFCKDTIGTNLAVETV